MAKEATEVEIIKVLKEGGFVSGQSLSSRLGISRTAVWKHIKALKKMGYGIAASPSKGYMLDTQGLPFNGVEVASVLDTEVIGKEVHFFDDLGSTNLKAFELGRTGAPEGTVVIADAQSAGKGRIGRRWESPPGMNLYTSIILRPPVPPQAAQNLTFLAAVAVAGAIEGYCGPPEVKWPNDILIEGKKVAGILMEMDSELDRIHFVVAGIGININMEEASMPEGIRDIATSVRTRSGKAVDRARLAGALYSGMEKWYKVYLKDGFAPIRDAWKRYFRAEGKSIKVVSFSSATAGICAGIDDDGALLLRTPAGKVERVISGDVLSARNEAG